MFYKYLTKLTWQSVEKYHLGQILLLIFKFFFLDSKRVSMAITMESYVVYIISNPLAKTCIELFFCKQKRIVGRRPTKNFLVWFGQLIEGFWVNLWVILLCYPHRKYHPYWIIPSQLTKSYRALKYMHIPLRWTVKFTYENKREYCDVKTEEGYHLLTTY
jgi:hypothetical protein